MSKDMYYIKRYCCDTNCAIGGWNKHKDIADDVAILSRNKNALKDALGNIESAARERDLLINE